MGASDYLLRLALGTHTLWALTLYTGCSLVVFKINVLNVLDSKKYTKTPSKCLQ